MSNSSTPHQESAQRAGLASLRWCYPFPDRNGKEITDPQNVYLALARMEDGFFPLGVNGFPHGGVHFGEGSASLLDQSVGARCIANGEIVAYRIDDAYPQLHFTQDGRWAMYSTGFVLVRHRMTMAAAPGSTGTQPADETLTFYSLYMHLADWNTYLSNDGLRRPGWWLGVKAWRIESKDQQAGGGARGTLVRTAPKAVGHGRFTAGETVGFLPEASEVTIGDRHGAWGHISEIRAGGMVSATSGAQFGSDDLNAPWVRPANDRAERATLTPEGDWGWINLHDNECLTEPNPLGTTVLPPQPIPVSAGMLLGQIGEYHDYERSTPLPPVAKRQLLHLEVFAGSGFKAFLEKSRARAAQAPAEQRTILLVQPGAKLVKEAFAPNLKLGDTWRPLVALKPTDDSPKDGPWMKVQPIRKESIFTLPDGAPVWIERKQGEQSGAPSDVPAWSVFPLQVKLAATPVNGQALAFARAQLDGQKAGTRAVDDQGVNWWRVQIGTAEGGSDWGWVCEKAHPGTLWESPWAWPGFGIVDATGIQLTDAFRRNLSVTGSADWKEQQEFEPSTQAVNGSELLGRLEQTVSRMPVPYGHKKPEPGPNGRALVTARKLQQALNTSWLAGELSHVILQYESEWGGNMARWEAITPLMRSARENWTCELQRIKKLQWWDEVKGKIEGFPDSPVVYHIHPVALVGNFSAPTLSIEEARVRALLRVIRVGEGTSADRGYATLYGGGIFQSFADHPRTKVTAGRYTSTAAGAYQILEATWDGLVKKNGYSNFTPQNQDRAAVQLLITRHALEPIKNEDLEKAIQGIGGKTEGTNKEWASQPDSPYGQPVMTMDAARKLFIKYLDDELHGNTTLSVPQGELLK
jgi:muramidase (phage lysozyme)